MKIRAISREDAIANVQSFLLLTIAVVIGVVALVMFLIPSNISPTGVTGIGVLSNAVFGIPISLPLLLLNIPILYLGYRMLPGGVGMLLLTGYAVILYSLLVEVLAPLVPEDSVSDNALLNAIFGGVLTGISSGLVYRSGGNFGGTSTLALIFQRKYGMPMSSTYLYLDSAVLVLAGLVFGWEAAMYAAIVLFISGQATDYALDGPSVIRTAVIVTERPREVSDALIYELQRGVSGWEVTGMYSGTIRTMLYVSISRSEMRELTHIVLDKDPKAFIVIGQGHVAYGAGFRHIRPKRKPPGNLPVTPGIDTASPIPQIRIQ